MKSRTEFMTQSVTFHQLVDHHEATWVMILFGSQLFFLIFMGLDLIGLWVASKPSFKYSTCCISLDMFSLLGLSLSPDGRCVVWPVLCVSRYQFMCCHFLSPCSMALFGFCSVCADSYFLLFNFYFSAAFKSIPIFLTAVLICTNQVKAMNQQSRLATVWSLPLMVKISSAHLNALVF